MGEQPAPGKRLGELRTLVARRGGGEVAQPGKPLKLLGQRAADPDAGEIHIDEAERRIAIFKPSGEQSVTARAIAGDMIARDRDQPQRLAARPEQARQR